MKIIIASCSNEEEPRSSTAMKIEEDVHDNILCALSAGSLVNFHVRRNSV